MTDEDKRKRLEGSKVNRYNLTTAFNLLVKCVPGTEKLNRPDIFVSTVNYIRELDNYIRELEKCIKKNKIHHTRLFSTPTHCDQSTGMEQSDSTLDCYIVPSSPMAEGLSSPMETGPSSLMATGLSSPMATGPSSHMATGLNSQMATGLSSLMVTGPSSPMVYTTELVTGLSSLMAEYSDISVPNSPMVYTTELVTPPSSPRAEYSDISELSSLMAEGPNSPMAEGPSSPMVTDIRTQFSDGHRHIRTQFSDGRTTQYYDGNRTNTRVYSTQYSNAHGNKSNRCYTEIFKA
jgi:hypothetical protein